MGKSNPQKPLFFTVRQAAGELGISYAALNRAINEGRVPAYKISGSRRLVALPEIEACIRANRTGGDDQPDLFDDPEGSAK